MSNNVADFLLSKAQAIVDRAQARDGKLTPAEKAEADGYIRRVEQIRETDALRDHIENKVKGATASGVAGTPGATLVDLLSGAGFHYKANPSVTVNAYTAFKQAIPAVTDLSRREPGQVVAIGQDTRFLHPWLPRESTNGDTAVQDFKQVSRDLTGTVERDLTATTTKASVATGTELVVAPVKMFAVTIDDIPNAVLESAPQFRAYWDQEGRFQVEKALDAHVMAQIVAASPPFGQDGANLIERVRNGIGTMRATGSEPDLLVLNPTDAAALDLSKDEGGYIFATRAAGTGSPLWGPRVVERAGAGSEPPYLIDSRTLGLFYLGSMRIDADPYTGFRQNTTTLRVEVDGLFHVRAAWGARRVAAA